MTDREKAGLRGGVRICLSEHTVYRRSNAGGEVEEHRFRTTCEYDSGGKLVRQTWGHPDGSEQAWVWQPDMPRNPNETITQRGGKKVRVTRVHQAPAARCQVTFHAIEGSDSGYAVPGTSTIETICDENERPAEVLFLNKRGRCLSRVSLVRDGQGRIVEEHQYMTGRGLALSVRLFAMILAIGQRRFFGREPFSSRYHRYDEGGRLIETRSGLGGLGFDRRNFEYNEHGDKIGELDELESREVAIDWRLRRRSVSERHFRSEARMEYRYDERGNWIEQSVYSRSAPERSYEIASVCRRAIEYD